MENPKKHLMTSTNNNSNNNTNNTNNPHIEKRRCSSVRKTGIIRKPEKFLFDTVIIKTARLQRSESQCSIHLTLDDDDDDDDGNGNGSGHGHGHGHGHSGKHEHHGEDDLIMEYLDDLTERLGNYEPLDWKEEYRDIVSHVVRLYRDVVNVMWKEKLVLGVIKEKKKIKTPNECIEKLEKIIKGLLDIDFVNSNHKQPNNYELLLQKSEAKIREHIRNEQQLKVGIESLQSRIEDREIMAKRTLQVFSHGKNVHVKAILWDLNNGNKRLLQGIKDRDEEIYFLSAEIEDLKEKLWQLELGNKALLAAVAARDKPSDLNPKNPYITQKLAKNRSEKTLASTTTTPIPCGNNTGGPTGSAGPAGSTGPNGGIIPPPEMNTILAPAPLLAKTSTPTRMISRLPIHESLSTGIKSLKNQLTKNHSMSKGGFKKLNEAFQESLEYEASQKNEESGDLTKRSKIFQSRILSKPPLREREKGGTTSQEKSANSINPASVRNKDIPDTHGANLTQKKLAEHADQNNHHQHHYQSTLKIPKTITAYEPAISLHEFNTAQYKKKKGGLSGGFIQENQEKTLTKPAQTISSEAELEANDKTKFKANLDIPIPSTATGAMMMTTGHKSHENLSHMFNKGFMTGKAIAQSKTKKKLGL